ncbi:Rab GTPase [Tieghemostelium lacteum]|uniref:Rab GTPase n=1 Tax=Tieghemostelium lacteum TaxID=361077 RepID=A0A152A1D0_TIELA|nr:Rab GTPase [Tieghemostelium lacteum]|eukprot:KYR00014.1 Rab GTPase [Tieghemostelium lacteum]
MSKIKEFNEGVPTTPIYKLTLIGKSGCGKSNLIIRYIHNKYREAYRATIGVDFLSKICIINQENITLQVWDCGQLDIKTQLPMYCIGTNLLVLVYDVNDVDSFNYLTDVIKHLRDTTYRGKIALLGNKLDRGIRKKVQDSDINSFCQLNDIVFSAQVSAKDSIDVDTSFDKILRLIVKKSDRNNSTLDKYDENTSLLTSKQKSRSCCG